MSHTEDLGELEGVQIERKGNPVLSLYQRHCLPEEEEDDELRTPPILQHREKQDRFLEEDQEEKRAQLVPSSRGQPLSSLKEAVREKDYPKQTLSPIQTPVEILEQPPPSSQDVVATPSPPNISGEGHHHLSLWRQSKVAGARVPVDFHARPGAYREGGDFADDDDTYDDDDVTSPTNEPPQETGDPTFVIPAELAESDKPPVWTTRRILGVSLLVLVLVGVIVGVVVALSGGGTSGNNEPDSTSSSPTMTPQPTVSPSFQPTAAPTLQGTWSQVGPDFNGRQAGDLLGYSVCASLDGRIFAVGAPEGHRIDTGLSAGQVQVFVRQSTDSSTTTWSPLGQLLEGDAREDRFGASLALAHDGTVLAVGAPGSDNGGKDVGAVHVYQLVDQEWVRQGQRLEGGSDFDLFGSAVSLSKDGRVLAVAAPKDDNNESGDSVDWGSVTIYSLSPGGDWVAVGNQLVGSSPTDQFGKSISLSSNGESIAVGAFRHDVDAVMNTGQVQVFKLQQTSGLWARVGSEFLDRSLSGGMCGISTSLSGDGNILAFGCHDGDLGPLGLGRVRVYQYNGSSWVQLGDDLVGEVQGDQFGRTVSLSIDGTVVAGGSTTVGQVRVYRFENERWSQIGHDIVGSGVRDISTRSTFYTDGTSTNLWLSGNGRDRKSVV